MHDGFASWHWGFGFGHWGFGLLFWAVIIALIIFGVQKLTGNSKDDGDSSQ